MSRSTRCRGGLNRISRTAEPVHLPTARPGSTGWGGG
jgi:hypothetical protein